MNLQIYVWIEGGTFSPQEFQASLNPNIQGTIEFRKRLRDEQVERTREHWKSPILEATDTVSAIAKLHQLLEQLHPAIRNIGHEDITVVAELVSRSDKTDDIQGFYLSREIIALLSAIGASLDIDQYE